ncbi:MAG: acyl carrier protein [Clostridia bacterium]|nr:acyl carrier protein [Oscillospiraceae bacterium]MBQ3056063.1 acyl carrier protein [Clostridia bacterium]MBR2312906.1 acyl carrier protein [Clostridia bacterium]MBR2463810.1 acyl carrier protein [Clostridia bacterium]MBR3863424.1 acyl carrier protein [Clostridia bacterium]
MFDKVKQILIDELQLDESEITLDAELSKDLGINSIELADLIMMCEEQFGIEISEDDANEFVTVNDIVNYLEKL